MRTPSISVVIPTFNRAGYVARAIDSVLAQTFRDFELIVVDDGSSDDTPDVLSRFGERIRSIRQENRGVSSARNAGIRAARGQWVSFLDSDDEWCPEKLERQMHCLTKYGGKICFSRCITENGEAIRDIEDCVPTIVEPQVYRIEDGADVVYRGVCHPQLQSLVVDKQLLEQAGLFDESLFGAEDTRLVYNLAFLSGLTYVDHPLVVIHRRTANSLLDDWNPESSRKRYGCRIRVQAEAYWRLLEIHPKKAIVVRKKLGYFISRRAELACAANQLGLARAIAKDGILFAGDLRTFVRCLGLYACPGLFRRRLVRKWYKVNSTLPSAATQRQDD